MDELFNGAFPGGMPFLTLACLASLLGGWLVLGIAPLTAAVRERIGLPRLLGAGLLLGLSGWVAFVTSLEAGFPHLDPRFPAADLVQAWAVQVAGAVGAVVIAARDYSLSARKRSSRGATKPVRLPGSSIGSFIQ